jgi:hypothetical protein
MNREMQTHGRQPLGHKATVSIMNRLPVLFSRHHMAAEDMVMSVSLSGLIMTRVLSTTLI